MRSFLIVTLLLFLVAPLHAQRTRPPTDIRTGEEPFIVGSWFDGEIILYAAYGTSGAIRAYYIWNISNSPVTVRIFTHSNPASPLEINASPDARGIAPALSGTVASGGEGLGIEDIERIEMGHSAPVRRRTTDRDWPFATGR